MRRVAIASVFLVCGIFAYYLYQNTQSKIDPAHYESQFNYASQLLIDGENDKAIDIFKKLIASNNTFPAVHFNLGRAYSNKKEWDKAIQAFDHVLQFNVPFAELVHFQKGFAAYNKEDLMLAQNHFEKVLELKPDHAECLYLLGIIAQKHAQLDKAAAYLTRAVVFSREFVTPLLSVAHDLRNEEKLNEAYACCSKALEVDPQGKQAYYAHLMMGDVDNMQGRPESAIKHYEMACALNPQCHESFNNLGALYAGQYGDLEKARPYLERAHAIKPDHAGTRAGLSALYLMLGDYERGWKEYEFRLEHFFEKSPRVFEKPRWDGKESLAGKTIVVHAEQGLGDTLQFIRYAQLIKNMGARVVVEVQKPLMKILSLCPYIDQVMSYDNNGWPAHDLHVQLMSLPYLMKTQLATIPAQIPYLQAAPHLVEEWKQKLSVDKNKKIGICWHVEPTHDADVFRGEGKTISISGCKRSVPLQLFMQLAKMKGISVYSLQKHNGLEEFAQINKNGLIKDFGADFDASHGSFMDTAAIMKNLDLVITADTSIAHLAGGLGVPVWVIVPFPSDWRWLLNRNDTPWYKSMTIFRRQFDDKDWSRVMNNVVASFAC